jgi:hypothetical protein
MAFLTVYLRAVEGAKYYFITALKLLNLLVFLRTIAIFKHFLQHFQQFGEVWESFGEKFLILCVAQNLTKVIFLCIFFIKYSLQNSPQIYNSPQ